MLRPVSPVTKAWSSLRGGLIAVAVFSLALNLLMLAAPLYMLQVYDRVLTSQNVDTLIGLSLLLGGVFLFMAGLDLVRTRILGRLGARFERGVGVPILEAAMRRNVQGKTPPQDKLVDDISGLRDFIGGSTLTAVFDAPWIPVYLAVLYLLHPYLGLLGLAGAVFLAGLALVNNLRSRRPMAAAAEAQGRSDALFRTAEANADLIQAMGMRGDLARRWGALQLRASQHKMQAGDRSSGFAVISKTVRMALQSAILGLGAALAITGETTAGAMIAATIVLGRALAPIDQLIGQWRTCLAARASYQKIAALAAAFPEGRQRLQLPRPRDGVRVSIRHAGPPQAQMATLSGLQFAATAGEAVAVIGPSGSGKSTLARMLAGVWMPQRGDVRLDGMPTAKWDSAALGGLIGYLPQDVVLFDGTIRENIARFSTQIDDAEVLAAAIAADVHSLIASLPDGYETRIDAGFQLSGGQRQRIALARALYGDPFLLVLDEPNSDLDANGEAALRRAIRAAQDRGAVVFVMTHRPSTLQAVDKVLVLNEGAQTAFGPKDTVLRETKRNVLAAERRPQITAAEPAEAQERIAK